MNSIFPYLSEFDESLCWNLAAAFHNDITLSGALKVLRCQRVCHLGRF